MRPPGLAPHRPQRRQPLTPASRWESPRPWSPPTRQPTWAPRSQPATGPDWHLPLSRRGYQLASAAAAVAASARHTCDMWDARSSSRRRRRSSTASRLCRPSSSSCPRNSSLSSHRQRPYPRRGAWPSGAGRPGLSSEPRCAGGAASCATLETRSAPCWNGCDQQRLSAAGPSLGWPQ